MRRHPRTSGQGTTEMLLLLCVIVGVVILAGASLKAFMPELFGKVAAQIAGEDSPRLTAAGKAAVAAANKNAGGETVSAAAEDDPMPGNLMTLIGTQCQGAADRDNCVIGRCRNLYQSETMVRQCFAKVPKG